MLNFESESVLEDFVWENLENLLNLTPIARQYYIDSQVCDILAVTSNKQLVVIELKNTQDRYLVQQLTRYFDSLRNHLPFAELVDYAQPIQLVALAPSFHKHNLVDRRHSLLNYQFFYFKITQTGAGDFQFEITELNTAQTRSLTIPLKYHRSIALGFGNSSESVRCIAQPPKSLRVIAGASSETQARVLKIRTLILDFDERMREVGLTTTTKYGLAKGKKEVYQGKLCAEILPAGSGESTPRLLLYLPYPRKERAGQFFKPEPVKGMAWAEVFVEQQWNRANIFFYLGKSRTTYSSHYTLQEYALVYEQLTGQAKRLDSLKCANCSSTVRVVRAAMSEIKLLRQ